eukprot:403335158
MTQSQLEIDQVSDLTFNNISKYLDKDSQVKLRQNIAFKNQIQKQTMKDNNTSNYQRSHTQSQQQLLNQSLNSSKHEEIIRRLVNSNQNFSADQNSVLSIPQNVIDEIEEYGLDSMSILQTVIDQFQYLFKSNSPPRFHQPYTGNMKKSSILQTQQISQTTTIKLSKDNQRRRDKLLNKLQQYEQANVFTLNDNSRKSTNSNI